MTFTRAGLMAVVLVLVLVATGCSATTLNAPPGMEALNVRAIGPDGAVVGESAPVVGQTGTRATLWPAGSAAGVDLGTIPGWADSTAVGIAGDGTVVGTATRRGVGDLEARDVVTWTGPTHVLHDLGGLYDLPSTAAAISPTGGFVAGWATAGHDARFPWIYEAARGFVELPLPPQFAGVDVGGVNSRGDVVGSGLFGPTDDRSRALKWTRTPSGYTVQELAGSWTGESGADDIDEDGTIVGRRYTLSGPDDQLAVVWSAGGPMVVLPHAADETGGAYAVANGHVLGYLSSRSGGDHRARWDRTASGWVLGARVDGVWLTDLNSRGQASGWIEDEHGRHMLRIDP